MLSSFVRLLYRNGSRPKAIITAVLGIWLLEFTGMFRHLAEIDYFTEFHYPLEGDVQLYVQQLKEGKTPDVAPINEYTFPYLIRNDAKCRGTVTGKYDNIRLLFVVKSAISNIDRRNAIRQSWGWEKRFSDVEIRRVFVVGIQADAESEKASKRVLQAESALHGDIVRADFVDSYFNNTIKTMMGFRWVLENCPKAQFIMFVDDDMYVSAKNVLRFLRNPLHYPGYLQQAVLSDPLPGQRKLKQIQDKFRSFDIDDAPGILFTGFVFFSSPQRHKFSKWYIPLDEYRFSMFPPYVTAGSYIVSFRALQELYYTSFYTKSFRFDDVYLGIVAKKAEVIPVHNDNFYFYKQAYNEDDYQFTIASHGYEDTSELLKVWNEQRSLGNA